MDDNKQASEREKAKRKFCVVRNFAIRLKMNEKNFGGLISSCELISVRLIADHI